MIVPLVPLHGERVAVPERMIVAPGVGVFRPCTEVEAGSVIRAGDVVGELVGPGTNLPGAQSVRRDGDGDARTRR